MSFRPARSLKTVLAVSLGVGAGLSVTPWAAFADDVTSATDPAPPRMSAEAQRAAFNPGPRRKAARSGQPATGPRLALQGQETALQPKAGPKPRQKVRPIRLPSAAAAAVDVSPSKARPSDAARATRSSAPPAANLTTCACKAGVQIMLFLNNVIASASASPEPAQPKEPNTSPLTQIAGWVRRELDNFLATPVVVNAVNAFSSAVFALYQDLLACAGGELSTTLPPDLQRTTVTSGLNQPTDFRFLPDGRLIVVEKGGAVKIVPNIENATGVIAGILPTKTDAEQGLVGIELDPDFTENGHVYLAYTTAQNHDRLSRFTLTGDIIDLDSEYVLMESAEASGPIHHGGEIIFGPDGALYWATGDNSESTNAAALDNIHGKILRMNPDGSAPPDNPFVGDPTAVPQIFAYGLRNPFRFTFTPTGQLLAGDVGGILWEELNLVASGGNFGWPSAEGYCGDCGFVNPAYSYPHTDPPAKAGSITAVMVYTGEALPTRYRDKVFIADFTLGWIKELTMTADYSAVVAERVIDSKAGTTVKLAQGPDGNIYQLNIFPGELIRISASGGNRPPTAAMTATPAYGYSPLDVRFSSAGSVDPDPLNTLRFTWDFGDGTTSSAANPIHTYAANGTYAASLTVSDGMKTSSASQTIVVGSTPPQIRNMTPIAESRYNAGDLVAFSAEVTDAEDGDLPDSAYEWTVVFHHADHTHPYGDGIIGPRGTISLSTSEHNVDTTWYRFALTVTDSSGLATTQSVDIRPNLVTLTFGSNEPGATYTVDGIPHTGTRTERAVVGVIRVLDVPSPQTVNGIPLSFDSWSDGGAQRHPITTGATDTEYTANFIRNNV